MEREREVIQSLNPADVHRMAELVLMGWRFSLKPKVMAGGGYGWVALSPDKVTADRYAQSLHSLIGYVNNYYLEDDLPGKSGFAP